METPESGEKDFPLELSADDIKAEPIPLKVSLSIVGVICGLVVLFIYHAYTNRNSASNTTPNLNFSTAAPQATQQESVQGASTEVMGPPAAAGEKEGGEEEASPTTKPTATATPTSAPNATPTPTPSPTPQATNTPTPQPTNTPTPTPAPTSEPTTTPTPTPTAN